MSTETQNTPTEATKSTSTESKVDPRIKQGSASESPIVKDMISKAFKKEPKVEAPKNEAKTEPVAPTAEKAQESAKPVEPAAAEAKVKDESKKTDSKAEPKSDDEGIAENDWKAAKAKRAELKRLADEREAALLDAKKKLEDYQVKVPDLSEVERLRKEHKEMADRMKAIDLKEHPEYKRKFVEPKREIVNQLEAILRDNGVEGVDVNALANKPRSEIAKAVNTVVEQLGRFDEATFVNKMHELVAINGSEKSVLENASESLRELRQRAEAQQRATFEDVYKSLSVNSFVSPVLDGNVDDKYKSQVEAMRAQLPEVRKKAESYAFGANDEKSVAELSVKAANHDFMIAHAWPRMVDELKSMQALIEQQNAKLKELSAQRPDSHDKGVVGEKAKPVSRDDLISRAFRGELASR